MSKCPGCDTEYEIGDLICNRCGAELPEPYDAFIDSDDESDEVENPIADGTDSAQVMAALSREVDLDALLAQMHVPPAVATILAGATVFLGDLTLDAGTVILAGDQIVSILEGTMPDPRNGAAYLDLTGQLLSAGFIDVHLHGMMGVDANTATVEDFHTFSREAAKRGVTALVPTTVACPAGELCRALENLRAAMKQGSPGARLLGMHLESNFISPTFKGAQPPQAIFSPEDELAWEIRRLLDEYAKEVRIVTVAPEVPGVLEFIPWLRERHIIASMGHSAATYEQALAAIEAGATHATHLFNAMPPLHHRAPGLVGAALESDAVFVETVCDGVHVHPAVISTIISAKGAERFMPISDSLPGAGMTEGEFTFAGQHITVKEGVARLDSGTIAGSIVAMDDIVRFLVEHVGWDLGETLMMASTTPADGLGISGIGRIAPGAVADLVVLDQGLQVQMTIVGGKIVFRRDS